MWEILYNNKWTQVGFVGFFVFFFFFCQSVFVILLSYEKKLNFYLLTFNIPSLIHSKSK